MKIFIPLNNYSFQPMYEVAERMKTEHDNYYGKPCGSGRGYGYTWVESGPYTVMEPKGRKCFTRSDIMYAEWVTSGQNIIRVGKIPEYGYGIYVEGVRHGIPWRFIDKDMREEIEHIWILKTRPDDMIVESHTPDVPPWLAGGRHPLIWGEAGGLSKRSKKGGVV